MITSTQFNSHYAQLSYVSERAFAAADVTLNIVGMIPHPMISKTTQWIELALAGVLALVRLPLGNHITPLLNTNQKIRSFLTNEIQSDRESAVKNHKQSKDLLALMNEKKLELDEEMLKLQQIVHIVTDTESQLQFNTQKIKTQQLIGEIKQLGNELGQKISIGDEGIHDIESNLLNCNESHKKNMGAFKNLKPLIHPLYELERILWSMAKMYFSNHWATFALSAALAVRQYYIYKNATLPEPISDMI